MGTTLDDEIAFAMYDFAFHSVKTALLHSGSEKSRNPKLAEACISSARAAFAEVQHMRGMDESQLSKDGLIWLGNWSVVLYLCDFQKIKLSSGQSYITLSRLSSFYSAM
jgi:hypothetical protein